MRSGRRHKLRRRAQAWTALLLFVALGVASAGPRAGVARPVEWTRNGLHIKILMRALTYEQSLAKAQGASLRIGVLYDPRSNASVKASMTAISLFEEQARVLTFKARRILVVGVPVPLDDGRLVECLSGDLKVTYLTPGLPRETVERIVGATRYLQIISTSPLRDYVRWGVSLGVVLVESKPRILINRTATRLEGVSFSSQLLQLAEIVEEAPAIMSAPSTGHDQAPVGAAPSAKPGGGRR